VELKHVEKAETKGHVVKCEYNSSCVETFVANGYWNTVQNKTGNVRDYWHHVNDVVNVSRVAFKLGPEILRVFRYNLPNKRKLFK